MKNTLLKLIAAALVVNVAGTATTVVSDTSAPAAHNRDILRPMAADENPKGASPIFGVDEEYLRTEAQRLMIVCTAIEWLRSATSRLTSASLGFHRIGGITIRPPQAFKVKESMRGFPKRVNALLGQWEIKHTDGDIETIDSRDIYEVCGLGEASAPGQIGLLHGECSEIIAELNQLIDELEAWTRIARDALAAHENEIKPFPDKVQERDAIVSALSEFTENIRLIRARLNISLEHAPMWVIHARSHRNPEKEALRKCRALSTQLSLDAAGKTLINRDDEAAMLADLAALVREKAPQGLWMADDRHIRELCTKGDRNLGADEWIYAWNIIQDERRWKGDNAQILVEAGFKDVGGGYFLKDNSFLVRIVGFDDGDVVYEVAAHLWSPGNRSVVDVNFNQNAPGIGMEIICHDGSYVHIAADGTVAEPTDKVPVSPEALSKRMFLERKIKSLYNRGLIEAVNGIFKGQLGPRTVYAVYDSRSEKLVFVGIAPQYSVTGMRVDSVRHGRLCLRAPSGWGFKMDPSGKVEEAPTASRVELFPFTKEVIRCFVSNGRLQATDLPALARALPPSAAGAKIRSAVANFIDRHSLEDFENYALSPDEGKALLFATDPSGPQDVCGCVKREDAIEVITDLFHKEGFKGDFKKTISFARDFKLDELRDQFAEFMCNNYLSPEDVASATGVLKEWGCTEGRIHHIRGIQCMMTLLKGYSASTFNRYVAFFELSKESGIILIADDHDEAKDRIMEHVVNEAAALKPYGLRRYFVRFIATDPIVSDRTRRRVVGLLEEWRMPSQQISTEIADVVLDNWTADNSRIPGDLAIARRFNRADISPQVIGALTEQCYRYLAGGDFSDLDPEFKAVGSLLREWGVSYSDILAGQQAASYGLKNRNEIFDQI